MKNSTSLALLAISLLAATTTQAQSKLRFGFEGGLNVTKASLSPSVFETSNRLGYYVGPKVKFTLPVVGVGMDISALYDYRETKLEIADATMQTFKQKNVVIPINVRYTIGLGSAAGIYAAAGPQIGFNVGDDTFNWKDKAGYESTFQLKKSNFSFNLGGGIYFNRIEINARYNIPVSKTADIESVTKAVESAKDRFSSRSNTWQIGVAYYF